jgi:hypothetical protein
MLEESTPQSIKVDLAPFNKPSVMSEFHSETTIPNRNFVASGSVEES